jgi:hypothetical protein
MRISTAARKLTGLPSRIALLIGIGALSVGGAKADAPATTPLPNSVTERSGELCLWSEGGAVYLAEQDGRARRLPLGDTAEAQGLRELLQRRGATDAQTGIRLDRMLLAGAGGDGFHWTPPQHTATTARQPATPAADRTNVRRQGGAPQTGGPASGPTGPSPGERGSGG